MADTIRVGNELLDYMVSLTAALTTLTPAVEQAAAALQLTEKAESYEGDAQEELRQYFSSLAEHLQRLALLLQKAVQYVANTYETMYYNEEQLARYLETLQNGGEP